MAVVPSDATGVRTRGLAGFAWNLAEVRLDEVAADAGSVLGGSLAGGWAAWSRAVEQAIPVVCAFQVGGCQAVYELSVDYSRTRIQFGTPIGRFQRVQDQVINLVNHLDAARWTAYEALWKLDVGREASDSIHLAKASRQRRLLPGLQLRPRSPRRCGQHDRVRPNPPHHRLPHPVPLPRRPQVPPPPTGRGPGVVGFQPLGPEPHRFSTCPGCSARSLARMPTRTSLSSS